jgi:hypothetical protein
MSRSYLASQDAPELMYEEHDPLGSTADEVAALAQVRLSPLACSRLMPGPRCGTSHVVGDVVLHSSFVSQEKSPR